MTDTPPVLKLYDVVSAIATERHPTGTLYHYTSREGMVGIATSGDLWASDVRFVNDAAEIRYGINIVTDALKRRRTHASQDQLFVLDAALALVSQRKEATVFAVSFCEEGNRLNQWQSYGKGSGFSIGFRGDAPGTLFRRIGGSSGFYYAAIEYSEDKQTAAADAFVQELLVRAGSAEDRAAALQAFAVSATFFASVVKAPDFRDEREWRLCTTRYSGLEVRYRATPHGIVPYTPLRWRLTQLAVAELEVIVGPGTNQDLSVSAVEMMLTVDPMLPASKARVWKSEITLRNA